MTLPQVVDRARLLRLAVLRVDLAPDGPQRTRTPLDPDENPLRATAVVPSVDDPFGERPADAGPLTLRLYNRPAMGIRDALAGAFSFLRSGSQSEERVAQYVIREHHRGRPLAEILQDHYVTNRLSPDQVGGCSSATT